MLKVNEIVKSSNGILVAGDESKVIDSVVIDSREAKKGSLFVALKGQNTDGHKYIKSAYENGCEVFLVSEDIEDVEGITIVKVPDTEIALGDISKYYREKFNIPFIGVTGSVGKTTTRDMIYAVTSYKYNTLRNEKNYNNQIGVPLTLFKLRDYYKCAIIEMGMCGFGEIKYLANIVKPKIAVISNIGQSHIEKLGSREGILSAKLEIATYFDESKVLIINGDDPLLKKVKEENPLYKVITFGYEKWNDIYCKSSRISEDKSNFICSIEGEDIEFEIPIAGKHNIYNAMSAILVGKMLGIKIEDIKEGLKQFKPTGMRQAVIKIDEYTIINDAYNASPDSMKASLSVLGCYEGRRVAILGDIFEMGEYVEQGMREVGKCVLNNADILITVGEHSKYIGIEAMKNGFRIDNIYHYKDKELVPLEELLKTKDTILVKASRGMELEYLVEKLTGEK